MFVYLIRVIEGNKWKCNLNLIFRETILFIKYNIINIRDLYIAISFVNKINLLLVIIVVGCKILIIFFFLLFIETDGEWYLKVKCKFLYIWIGVTKLYVNCMHEMWFCVYPSPVTRCSLSDKTRKWNESMRVHSQKECKTLSLISFVE